MSSLSGPTSIARSLITNPVQGGFVAGAAACVIIQVARRSLQSRQDRSFQRGSSSILAKYVLTYGPAAATGLIIWLGLRFLTGPYKAVHSLIDSKIAQESQQLGRRAPVMEHKQGRLTAFWCSNYPKTHSQAFTVFCDAFGYAETNDFQIVALADGCGWGKETQRSSRTMVDGFMRHALENHRSHNENTVREAALHAQDIIQANHADNDLNKFYGDTTFLGGLIVKGPDNKRYMFGINCGNCKLYLLRQGLISEVTKAARGNGMDSQGRFGPNRQDRNKTEYTMIVELDKGDKLLFMTDGVHDNMDKNPPAKDASEKPEAADRRKVAHMQQYAAEKACPKYIIEDAFSYTDKHLEGEQGRMVMPNASSTDYPGKPDHMTLLAVDIQ